MIINIKSTKYLSEMKTGRTYSGIEQIGEKERQRENGLAEREKSHWRREENGMG